MTYTVQRYRRRDDRTNQRGEKDDIVPVHVDVVDAGRDGQLGRGDMTSRSTMSKLGGRALRLFHKHNTATEVVGMLGAFIHNHQPTTTTSHGRQPRIARQAHLHRRFNPCRVTLITALKTTDVMTMACT